MSLDYKWKINYAVKASDEFRDLPKDLQKRISKKMRFFALSSDLPTYSKKLKDNKYGGYRFRIGNYRIVFDKIDKTKEIFVLKISKRDEVYK